jgi:2-dehydro-3-deoxyglucarate aldolase/4-hydroxy-2-oxoheptanedioate aldolase
MPAESLSSNRPFPHRLAEGDLLIGTIITLPAPEVAEIMSLAGMDWLFVDLEHSVLDLRNAQLMQAVVNERTACVIRVPCISEVWFKKCLDMGVDGIIVPQVESREDAEKVVELCKYPPEGRRSVGITRAHGYGANFSGYVKRANREVALILQIEQAAAVENIESIVSVAGIDALFIGPYDLSGSMGRIGEVESQPVKEAISHVGNRAREAGIALGIFGATVAAVKPYVEAGYQLIAVGIDTMLLDRLGRQIVASLRTGRPQK